MNARPYTFSYYPFLIIELFALMLAERNVYKFYFIFNPKYFYARENYNILLRLYIQINVHMSVFIYTYVYTVHIGDV